MKSVFSVVKINSPVSGFDNEKEKDSVDTSFIYRPKSFKDLVFEHVLIFVYMNHLWRKDFPIFVVQHL